MSLTARSPAVPPTIAPLRLAATRQPFGLLDDGTAIEAVTLTNATGISACVMTLGATLQSLRVPDRDGRIADIVLGHDDAAPYRATPHYFGATVGRYANRVAGARFMLDGRTFALDANDGRNHLHGGSHGFDQRVWAIRSVEDSPAARVVLEYRSADGEGGYPGVLDVSATYTLDAAAMLTITYEATTSQPTIVNLTNHSFFALGDGDDILDHRLTLDSAAFTPIDDALIPTGEIRAVAGTPFDFRFAASIGSRIGDDHEQLRLARGYDHNYVVDGAPGTLRRAARVEHSRSGRVLEVLTTAPGVQFYSGNFLDGSVVGKKGRTYRRHAGLCLEPQAFPDAPNQPHFPSPRLDPGEKYRSVIAYRFATAPAARITTGRSDD